MSKPASFFKWTAFFAGRDVLISTLIVFAKKIAFRLVAKILGLARPCASRSKAKTLTIYKVDFIGDFVIALGAIRHLQLWAKNNGFEEINAVVAPQCREIAERELPGIRFIEVPYGEDKLRGGFLAAMRTAWRGFSTISSSVCVSLRHPPSVRKNLLLKWLNSGVLYARDEARKYSDPEVSQASGDIACKELVAHAELLSLVTRKTVSPFDIFPRLTSYPLETGRNLLVFPFASSPIREYPPNLLAEVLSGAAAFGFESIDFCGNQASSERLKTLVDMVKPRVSVPVRIVFTPNISDAAQEISRAGMVLGMESGPAHLATALEKPGIFFLGGGHHGWFAPWGSPKRQRWIDHKLPCYHCNWKCPYEETRCLTAIHPTVVLTSIREVLVEIAFSGLPISAIQCALPTFGD